MTVIDSSFATDDNATSFSTGDTLTLATDAYTISTGANGIYMSGSGSDVYNLTIDGIVDGAASGTYGGIFLDAGATATISISETGQVRGDHGVILFAAATLNNDGAITSVNEDGVIVRTTGDVTINNDGEIVSHSANGIEFDASSSGKHTVFNGGVITASDFNHGAFYSSNKHAVDQITNDGIMNGNIYLGGGNDTFRNTYKGDDAGYVSGLISLGAGKDTFVGGDFGDYVSGGSGRDSLTGAGGSDEFVFNSKLGNSNADTITDFEHRVDWIYLDHTKFAGLATGDVSKDDFKVIANAQSTKGVDASDRLLYDRAHGDLYFDQDGSGTAHHRLLIAHLGANTAIDATDFQVY